MNCRVPRINRKMRKEIDGYTKERVAEYYEKQGEEITRRNFKLFCLALHIVFGFGGQRLAKLIMTVTELIEKSKTDEVFWFHTDRELRAIGLDFPNEDYEVMDK